MTTNTALRKYFLPALSNTTGGSSVFKQTAFDFELITPDAVKIHDSNSPPKIIVRR